MKYLIALSLLAVASCQWECDECPNCCPGGCCNYIDWLCCPNQMWCAPTLDDCPPVTEKDQLTNMAALKQKQCDGDGIACPGGCCPYLGWLCCPDGMHCAPYLDDCPTVVTEKTELTKMAALKQKQCDCCECPAGTDGPGGCCPMVGWECCSDGLWCAPTLDDCPVVTKKTKLAKMVVPKAV